MWWRSTAILIPLLIACSPRRAAQHPACAAQTPVEAAIVLVRGPDSKPIFLVTESIVVSSEALAEFREPDPRTGETAVPAHVADGWEAITTRMPLGNLLDAKAVVPQEITRRPEESFEQLWNRLSVQFGSNGFWQFSQPVIVDESAYIHGMRLAGPKDGEGVVLTLKRNGECWLPDRKVVVWIS